MSQNTKNGKQKYNSSTKEKNILPNKNSSALISDFPELNVEQNDQQQITIRSTEKENMNADYKLTGDTTNRSQSSNDIDISDNNEDECHICSSKFLLFIDQKPGNCYVAIIASDHITIIASESKNVLLEHGNVLFA